MRHVLYLTAHPTQHHPCTRWGTLVCATGHERHTGPARRGPGPSCGCDVDHTRRVLEKIYLGVVPTVCCSVLCNFFSLSALPETYPSSCNLSLVSSFISANELFSLSLCPFFSAMILTANFSQIDEVVWRLSWPPKRRARPSASEPRPSERRRRTSNS